jgi:hypothetical protein
MMLSLNQLNNIYKGMFGVEATIIPNNTVMKSIHGKNLGDKIVSTSCLCITMKKLAFAGDQPTTRKRRLSDDDSSSSGNIFLSQTDSMMSGKKQRN